jgi:hypothetical protein
MDEKRKPGATYHGSLPDTDPIYKGGWNFILAAGNLARPAPQPIQRPDPDGGQPTPSGDRSV